ncbi:TonB-dependent receptor [Pseudoalteromonas ardens]|uniref:TonB-dependent receptor n=1 Tax=Pseudoalteromonas ardens TaxID=3048490 RepID=UPI0024C43DB5|nr:TonB-dependent receptor [Pseudoalteromonas sp. R96]MDK1313434.1 TonB-dependent receptor [Pseudoalteromonas sp. R96]
MKLNILAKSVGLALISAATASTSAIADEAKELDVIVVQGQKIDRTLQETPSSVAVVTSKDMEQNNLQNINDVFAMMPNVAGDFNQGFSIRGVDSFSVSGGGNSFLTSMYLDGAPLPFRMVKSGGLSVWDLAQVEVFRGPQSTLQGRNALAGAIMMRSQDPTYEPSAKLKATVGQHGQQEYAFAGGMGLVENMLAFRISYEDKQTDGDIDNITRGDTANFENSETLRAKLLFEPNDDVDVLFTYTNNDNRYGAQFAMYDFGGTPFDRQVNYNSPIWEETKTDIYNLEASWDLNETTSLHSVTTYNESDYRYNWDGDMLPTQLVKDNYDHRIDETFSQEFRVTYESDAIQAAFGIYASQVDVDDKAQGQRLMTLEQAVRAPDLVTAVTGLLMQQGLPAEMAAQTAAAVAPFYPDIDPINLELNYGLTQKIKTAAIYGDLTWSVTDQVDLLAGLRYDTEEQTNSANNAYKINNPMPDPAQVPAQIAPVISGINAYLHGFAQAASGVEPATKEDFSAWLPKLGATYHFNQDMSTSFIYQKGYRSGGVGFNVARSNIFSYDPEYTNNYELSLRSVWLDGKLVINANAFLLKWQDQQVIKRYSSSPYDTETINAAESEVKGLETEVFYYPSSNWSVTAGVGLAKSEFTDFGHLTGRAFEDAPELTANLATNYAFDNGLYVNVNAKYTDSSTAYLDPAASLTAEKYAVNSDPINDQHTIVNTQLGYNWDNYTVRLDVRNLFDKEYVSTYFKDADNQGNPFTSYGQMYLGKSRQVSLTLQMDF